MKNLTVAGVPLICALAAMSVFAQSSGPIARAVPVERAIPFGTTTGKLLLLGNHIVYVDDTKVESSFAATKGELSNVTTEGANITVQFRDPMPDGSGTSTRAVFRAVVPTDAAAITSWYGSGAPVSAPAPAPTGVPATQAATETFEARHDHFRGTCKGRLIISANQLSYESVDEVGHSRRWEYSSIQEIKQKNPYELEVKPFTGGTYKLFIDGSGMLPATFKTLVDRVTAARAGRQ
ncbi:hypothetical protein F183_A49680 [Bryobacterales bacterium F-183]|nr:hypothetical protein F183_A49680 [Bryobacterales bacterium F-183]